MDVGLLRAGWATEGLTPVECSWWRRLTAGDLFRAAASSFSAVVPQPLELPSLMVSSDNDPYCAPQVAEQLATDWPSQGSVRDGSATSTRRVASADGILVVRSSPHSPLA
jgi:hypothetical protein